MLLIMGRIDEILSKIIDWAKNEDLVRGLLLQGSLTRQDSDELSDLDINVFVTKIEPFVKDDSWISSIAKVWVYSPDKIEFEGIVYPQRLVIYDQGTKVDFGLRTIDIITRLARSNFYDDGYKILLDKDNLLSKLPGPSFKSAIPAKPTQEEFTHAVKEYWFEEYHVAKYLKREDLWLVKFRDWSIKYYLLKMMEWYTLVKNNLDYDVRWDGKQIQKWLEPKIYNKLFNIYGHFETNDSWEKLMMNNNLFREISIKTAKLLGYKYPKEVDKNLTEFTSKLKDQSKQLKTKLSNKL